MTEDKKEILLETPLDQLLGLMFRSPKYAHNKIFIFKLKKPLRYIDVHTFFMRFPVKLTFLLKNQVIKEVELKPWKIFICKDFIDEVREEMITNEFN